MASTIKPSLHLTQAPTHTFSPMQLTTINGRRYLVSLLSTTDKGTQQHHSLEKKEWDKILPCLQRVILVNQDHINTPDKTHLAAQDIDYIHVPLDNSPIRYRKVGEANFKDLSPSEMTPLQDSHRTLRQTYINPQEHSHLNLLDTSTLDGRKLYLEEFTNRYPTIHKEIHHLHTSFQEDISEATFEFYVRELQNHSGNVKVLPTQEISAFNPDELTPSTCPLFIPLKIHEKEPRFASLFIDPTADQIFISIAKKEDKKNSNVKKVLEELTKRYPEKTLVYETAHQSSQSRRSTLLFLERQLSSDRKKKRKQDKDSIEKDCHQLAYKVQTFYNRQYERLYVLGAI